VSKVGKLYISEDSELISSLQSQHPQPVYVPALSLNSFISSIWYQGISSAYARDYLPGGGENQLTMRMGGSKDDTWASDFQVRNGRQQICGEGWRKFVTDNKLKPDDICLFNLRKNTKTLTMDVHIIQKRSV
jgi:hypothetical protein